MRGNNANNDSCVVSWSQPSPTSLPRAVLSRLAGPTSLLLLLLRLATETYRSSVSKDEPFVMNQARMCRLDCLRRAWLQCNMSRLTVQRWKLPSITHWSFRFHEHSHLLYIQPITASCVLRQRYQHELSRRVSVTFENNKSRFCYGYVIPGDNDSCRNFLLLK